MKKKTAVLFLVQRKDNVVCLVLAGAVSFITSETVKVEEESETFYICFCFMTVKANSSFWSSCALLLNTALLLPMWVYFVKSHILLGDLCNKIYHGPILTVWGFMIGLNQSMASFLFWVSDCTVMCSKRHSAGQNCEGTISVTLVNAGILKRKCWMFCLQNVAVWKFTVLEYLLIIKAILFCSIVILH